MAGRLRVYGVLGTLILALAAAAPADAKVRCRHGLRRVRGRCAVAAVLPKSSPRRAPVMALLQAASKLRARGRHPVKAALLRKGLRRIKGLDALVAAVSSTGVPASRRTVRDAASQPIDAGGWSGTTTVDIPVHDDQTGVDVTAHVTATDGHGAHATAAQTHTDEVANCPDVQGHVPGTSKRSYAMTITTPAVASGEHVKISLSYQATFTHLGQTSDDGTLHDWQQDMRFLASVQVAVMRGKKVVETNAPWVFTVNAAHDLVPGGDNALTTEMVGAQHAPGELFSIAGTRFFNSSANAQAAKKFLALAAFEWDGVAHAAGDAFAKAKAQHWDTGDCVKLALTAGKHQLTPGEAVPVTAQINTPTAPARLSASADRGGTVAPGGASTAGAPTAFTATAPTPFAAPDAFAVTVTAVSKQGHGQATVTFTAPPANAYRLIYTHTESGAVSYDYNLDRPYFVDHGSWSENRDLQVSATVPLTANGDGTFSGSATLAWDRATWSSDDQSTVTNNAGGTCSYDDKETLTAATPGSLTVSGLTPSGTPKATVVLAPLGETWHQDDTPISGPCPVVTNDDQEQRLLNLIGSDQRGAGDPVSYRYDPVTGDLAAETIKLDSGWQPGSGDTLATRTLTGAAPTGPTSAQSVAYTDTFALVRVTG